MFHFFKKYYVKDLLPGFIDIHCHILPGIDDGAKTIKNTVELLKEYNLLGVDHFIATPHIMQGFYENTEESIEQSLALVYRVLMDNRLSHVKIKPSAEYMLDGGFDGLIEQKKCLPLKDNYLLVEFSYLQPPMNFNEIIEKIKDYNYIPVLAHPERYAYFHDKIEVYKKLKQKGCFFQLNLLSLSGYYGKSTQIMAKSLLKENLIDFAGTDSHKKLHLENISTMYGRKEQTYRQLQNIIENTNEVFSF